MELDLASRGSQGGGVSVFDETFHGESKPSMAKFEGCNIHDNTAWQGGGVYVFSGCEATLTNSNVYQNKLSIYNSAPLFYVRSLFEPSSSPLELMN